MKRIYKIARREFLETIKTKAFIFSAILTPLLIFGIGFLNDKIAKSVRTGPQPKRQIVLIDRSGQLGGEIAKVFNRYNADYPQRTIALVPIQIIPGQAEQLIEQWKGEVMAGRLDGLLVTARNIDGEASGGASQFFAKAKNINDFESFGTIRRLLNEAVMARRYARLNLSPALVAQLNRPITLDQIDVDARPGSASGSRPQTVRMMIPLFYMLLMFMGIVGISQGMLTSVIEEKNSRVVEVLLAAVSPMELMAGKILGLSSVGLALIALWGTASAAAAAHFGLGGLFTPALLAWFILYFILGFLVIASLFAAVGSACNTLKEAQAFMTPLMMIVVLPMIVWLPIAQNPNGGLALAFSFIPTAAPMVMIMRLCADPDLPLLQNLAAMFVLAASTWGIVWLAGKIFRTGILMYGKPPTPREMLRWIRER